MINFFEESEMMSVTTLVDYNKILCISKGINEKPISQIMRNERVKETCYHIIKDDLSGMSFEVFSKDPLIKTLKNLGLWKTHGKGRCKKVFTTPQIWTLLAVELNPFMFCSAISQLDVSRLDLPNCISDESSQNINYYTYLMLDENTGFYKIGRSKNPKFREQTLQSQKPTIKLLFTSINDLESKLHKKYNSKRVRGEWFRLSDNDVIDIFNEFNKNK